MKLIENKKQHFIENLRSSANAKQYECFAECCRTKFTQSICPSISQKFDESTPAIYGRKFDLPLSTNRIPTAAHVTTSLLFLFSLHLFFVFIFFLSSSSFIFVEIIILLIQMFSIDACI